MHTEPRDAQGMVARLFRLTQDQDRKVKRVAKAKGISEAAVVRALIDRLTEANR